MNSNLREIIGYICLTVFCMFFIFHIKSCLVETKLAEYKVEELKLKCTEK